MLQYIIIPIKLNIKEIRDIIEGTTIINAGRAKKNMT